MKKFKKLLILLIFLISRNIFSEELNFFPTPQKLKYEGKIVTDKSFKILSEGVSFNTVREFKYYLRKWGFLEKEDGILFSLKKVPLNECKKVCIQPYQKKVLLEEPALQTYFMKISNKKVEIKAAGEDGFFYALMTFKNMFKDLDAQKISLFKVNIIDYPVFPVRGIFEGGYGIWDKEGRLKVLEWMGEVKLNYYLYGPKSDPKIRRRWRELYDDVEIFYFKRVLEVANRNHINFVYTIAPTLGIEYSSEEDFKTLLKKVRQMQTLGVKNFILAFDDTLGILYSQKDRKKFANLGEAEAYLANKLYKSLKEYDSEAQLVVVPEIYSGVFKMDYTNSLVEKLLPEIHIGWTGPEVGAPKIDAKDMQNFINFYKRSPSIGDNWGSIYPLLGRNPEIHKYTTQFTVNPYNLIDDAGNNYVLVPIECASLAEFCWNSYSYNPENVIETLGKIYFKEEANSIFKMLMYAEFYRFSSGYFLDTDYQTPLEKKLREILKENNREDLKKYVRENLNILEKIENSPHLIQTECRDKEIGEPLYKILISFSEYFQNLRDNLRKIEEGILKNNNLLEKEGVEKILENFKRKNTAEDSMAYFRNLIEYSKPSCGDVGGMVAPEIFAVYHSPYVVQPDDKVTVRAKVGCYNSIVPYKIKKVEIVYWSNFNKDKKIEEMQLENEEEGIYRAILPPVREKEEIFYTIKAEDTWGNVAVEIMPDVDFQILIEDSEDSYLKSSFDIRKIEAKYEKEKLSLCLELKDIPKRVIGGEAAAYAIAVFGNDVRYIPFLTEGELSSAWMCAYFPYFNIEDILPAGELFNFSERKKSEKRADFLKDGKKICFSFSPEIVRKDFSNGLKIAALTVSGSISPFAIKPMDATKMVMVYLGGHSFKVEKLK